MKKTTLLLTLAAALTGISMRGMAQASASATAQATATIVTPISISKTADLEFGNIAVSATTAGTVVLPPTGSRTATGGVTLPGTTGTVSAATFTVSGTANYTFDITLPTTATLKTVDGANQMTVSTFVSDPASQGTIAANGTVTIRVGGTLAVSAGQQAGEYSTASTDGVPFTVTVDYN